MGKPRVSRSSSGKPMHYSVGVFIINEEGKFLLVDRKKPPLGFACVAGHIDEGETPVQALVREGREESGFDLSRAEFIEIALAEDNECRHGVKIHHWNFYKCKCRGTPRLEKEGAHSIGWYSRAEIQEMADAGKLEPIWKTWFLRYKIIVPKPSLVGKISNAEPITNCVCKPEKKDVRCDFLCLTLNGWVCEKDTVMGKAIAARFAADGKNLRDNCKE